jgi:hypothetical protein
VDLIIRILGVRVAPHCIRRSKGGSFVIKGA